MRDFYKYKNSQIAVFVVISVILVFLVSYFVFISNESRSDLLKDNNFENEALDIIPIKNHIDLCLDRQLKRGVVIAGIKGGFIYENDEFYFPGAIPKGTYGGPFVSNLELNYNSLISHTLVHSQSEVYSPLIDTPYIINEGLPDEIQIYDKGVKEHFDRFIFEEFIKCFDFELYEELGFNLDFDRYGVELKRSGFDKQTIEVVDFSGDVDDRIRMTVGDTFFQGTIVRVDGDTSTLFFPDLEIGDFQVQGDVTNVWIFNLDSEVIVDTLFKDEKVAVNLFFPINVINEGDGSIVSYEDSLTEVNVRFLELLRLSSELANAKYFNKSLDLTNPRSFSDIVSRSAFSSTFNFDSIELFRTSINDSSDLKRYVYSMVDSDSSIFGTPYVFNFAYENRAPKIESVNLLGGQSFDDEILFLISKNNPISFDLKPLTSDEQAIDNLWSYYLEDGYEGLDAKYKLYENGTLEFEAFIDKRFTYNIVVSDHETFREHRVVFLVGLPDNSNNSLANDCLRFENYDIPNFHPIENEYRNKIFNFTDSSGYNNHYAYSLYIEPENKIFYDIPNSKIFFRESCLLSQDLYNLNVTIRNLDTNTIQNIPFNYDTWSIDVPMSFSSQEISFGVYEVGTGVLTTEEFKIKVYPSSCLGPDPKSSPEDLELYGGDLSCCNTKVIDDSILNNDPKNFVRNNNLESTGKIVDADSYFCMDIAQLHVDPNGPNYNSFRHVREDIWEYLAPDITSLYEARVQVSCDGISPVGRIDGASSSNPDLSLTSSKVYSGLREYDINVPVNLKKVQEGGTCSFCRIDFPSPFSVKINEDLIFFTGIKALNPTAGVSPIPLNRGDFDYSSTYVLCDDDWYKSEEGRFFAGDWDKSFTGLGGGEPSSIYVSKGYCYQGSSICSGRPGSPTFKSKFDEASTCTDWFVQNENIFENQPNTGWTCGINKTCNGGICG